MKQTALDTWIWLAHQAKKPAQKVDFVYRGAVLATGHQPRIPDEHFWPASFDGGNGVTGWADRWIHFDGFKEALWPFKIVDITALAWWHDLWYHLGYFVPWDTPLDKLGQLKPRPRSQRNWVQRRAADRHFRVGLYYLGLPRWRAKAAWKALNALGAPYYFYGGPAWTHDT